MPRNSGAFRQGIATGIGSAVGSLLVVLLLAALFRDRGQQAGAGAYSSELHATGSYSSEYAAMATPGACS